jgi:2-(1,2-epoxy-1,2-dihydrophenyl)acetyl-CoA isomerase
VSEAVLRSFRDGICTLRLNRPEARNALNRALRTQLRTALTEVSIDPEVAVLVLTGDDRAFCAGGDVKEMGGGAADSAAKLAKAKQIVQLIAEMPKPVVAAVRGHAAGAGFSLALACDFIVADPTAVFTSVFIRRALIPDMGATYWLARQVGIHRAKDIAMSGRPIMAQEAFDLGIVARLWSAEDFEVELGAFARQLAGGPTAALGLTKQLINRAFESDLSAALDAEALAQGLASSSPEHLDGLAGD